MTSVDVDKALLRTAIAVTGVKTGAEVVELALKELVGPRQRELLRQDLGTFDLDLDLEGLLLFLRQAEGSSGPELHSWADWCSAIGIPGDSGRGEVIRQG